MVSYKDFFSVKDSRTLLEGNRYASNRLLAKYLEMQVDFKQVGAPMYYRNPQDTMKLCESYDRVYGQRSKELGVEPK
jgi:hypothetical protein